MVKQNYYEEIIIAGFGGQGIIMLGKLLANAAMIDGLEVTYFPSYGAEVRGGTANCMVVISDEPIASPLVTSFDSVIVLNKASCERFSPRLKPGGLLLYNSSKIGSLVPPVDAEVLAIPSDEIAVELGSPRSTNMVAIGAYLQKRGVIPLEIAVKCLEKVLAKRHHGTIAINEKALYEGAEFAKSLLTCQGEK